MEPITFTHEEIRTVALLVWSTRSAPELVDRLEAWRDAVPPGETFTINPDSEDDEPLIDPNPGTFFDGNDWSGFGLDDD